MKVLQINTIVGAGSTGRIVEDILEMVIKHGDDGRIACAIDNSSEKLSGKIYKIGGRKNVRLSHAIASRITDRSGFYSRQATKKLIKYIEHEDFDLIHMHNLHGYYLDISLLFEKLAKMSVKVVWTFHDCWPMTGHCTYFDYIGCEKWKYQCGKCPQRKKYPKSIIVDNSRKNYVDKKQLFHLLSYIIVTPSAWLEDICRESFVSDRFVKKIPNGIDLRSFYPRDVSGLRHRYKIENKFVILAVSAGWNMRERNDRKGLADILELRKKLDNTYVIIMVGFKDEASMRGLPEGIIGVKKTRSLDELAEWYSVGDVFINPTKEEVLGMVNIEALACGTPVITYNTGGSPETVDDSCGIVLEKGNIDALRQAIIACRKENFEKEDCINRAKLFDKEKSYEEYYELYCQMLKTDI